jgi:putative tricarboxylic transport membrane protein
MPPDKSRRPGELVFIVLILLASLWLFWQSVLISGFSGLSTPGVFPMLASGVMVISGLWVLRDTARRAPDSGGVGRFVRQITPLRQVVMLGLVAIYVAVMPWLGFVVASGLFLFVSIGFLWRRNVVVTAGISAVSLGAIYLIFRVAFQVVLPRGTLLQGLF